MDRIKTSLFITICLLFVLALDANSQTHKGLWQTGGVFEFSQSTISGLSTSNILIQPELGYAFTDRWMVWGQLSIELLDKASRVGHQLEFRYAFLKRPELEGYVGMNYGFNEQRFFIRGGTRKIQNLTIGPKAGYLHFFNPGVALDVSLHYPVFYKSSFGEDASSRSGSLELNFGLNFYFDSKLKTDTTEESTLLEKGQWMIGGSIALGGGDSYGFYSTALLNDLNPYAGVLLGNRWMLGGRLSYNNSGDLEEYYFGIQPFGRYYFLQRKKRAFYAEANLGLSYRYLKQDNPASGLQSTEQSLGGAIGINRWILPRIALDFSLGYKSGYIRPRYFEDNFTFQQFVIRMGLEAYF